jgi:hypothetical protein
MKIISLILLVSPLFASSQSSFIIDSTRFISGNKCCTRILNAISTADKGLIFVGSDMNNPGGIIPVCAFDSSSTPNALIGKIDSSRHISWLKVYGGSRDDAAGSICQTPDSGYAVLATTGSSDGDISGFKGTGDIWLLRLNKMGNLLWQKCYGSPADDASVSIANTPDHGFIILGASNGSGGDVPYHYGDQFSYDWVVIKIDSAGAVQWSRDIGSINIETTYGSILVIDSSYYFISGTVSGDHDCVDTAWHAGVNTNYDLYIFKLDKSGNTVWAKSYGGTGFDIGYNALFDTKDSTIMVTGCTTSNDYTVSGNHGGKDIWVMKVAKDGTLIWQKTLGTANDEWGYSICPFNNGYIVYGSVSPGSVGRQDCWLFYLDSNGNVLDNKVFGGTNNEYPASIVLHGNSFAAVGMAISASFTEGITDGNSHTGAAFVTYIGYKPVEIPDVRLSAQVIDVYPNPAAYKVKFSLPEKPGTLKIYNSVGQLIYSSAGLLNNTLELGISAWPAGFYLIKWQDSGGLVLTGKFLKD